MSKEEMTYDDIMNGIHHHLLPVMKDTYKEIVDLHRHLKESLKWMNVSVSDINECLKMIKQTDREDYIDLLFNTNKLANEVNTFRKGMDHDLKELNKTLLMLKDNSDLFNELKTEVSE